MIRMGRGYYQGGLKKGYVVETDVRLIISSPRVGTFCQSNYRSSLIW